MTKRKAIHAILTVAPYVFLAYSAAYLGIRYAHILVHTGCAVDVNGRRYYYDHNVSLMGNAIAYKIGRPLEVIFYPAIEVECLVWNVIRPVNK